VTNGIFITGTDTGVGKTVIAAGLLRCMRSQDIDAVPIKPVETGVVDAHTDLQFCLEACGLEPTARDMADMTPFRYEPACSPHLAGRLAGSYPDIDKIVACAHRLGRSHEFVLMEGAGGVLAPLNESQTMLDLMVACRFPVILVARSGLGTINHTLLSLQAIRSRGLGVLGVVFNETQPVQDSDQFIRSDNPDCIERFGKVKVLGHVPALDRLGANAGLCWDAFDANMIGVNDLLKDLGRHAQ